jgi:hypothetical protein
MIASLERSTAESTDIEFFLKNSSTPTHFKECVEGDWQTINRFKYVLT